MRKIVLATVLWMFANNAFAETGVEKCQRLHDELGLSFQNCADTIIGSSPGTSDANDLLEEYIRRQRHSDDAYNPYRE